MATDGATEAIHATVVEEETRPVRGWQVGQWLLANDYLLTALELLVEAQESGKEADVEGLKHFFSDKDKFPPEELVKYDASDAINLQRQAKEREERLAIVEYELRIAKEDLAHLQKGNSGLEESRMREVSQAAAANIDEREPSSNDLPFKDRMALNWAVKQYLASHGYKLTALTFSEEAADATPRGEPPSGETLVGFFKSFKQQKAALAAAEEAVAAKAELQKEADRAEARLQGVQSRLRLQELLAAAQQEARLLRADLDAQQGKNDWLTRKLLEAERNENEARRAARESGVEAPAAAVTPAQSSKEEPLPGPPAVETNRADAVLLEVVEALPRFVPHMLINARVGLLPLFMTLIQELKDRPARDRLANAMFNIVKKPTAEQRQMICEAMAELAARIGPTRTAEELLPQCWEQVGHKHAERRMAVAECCGRVGPLVPPDMRGSLVLSMLQQLAGDREPAVQQAVAASLAALLPHLADLDKYRLVEGMVVGLVLERTSLVLEAVHTRLLPAVLEWTKGSELLHTSLFPAIMAAASKILHQCPLLGGVDEEAVKEGEPGLRVIGDSQQQQVQALLRVWVSLLQPLRAKALISRPAWVLLAAEGSPEEVVADRPADSGVEVKGAANSKRGENLPPANGGDAKCRESEQAAESLNEESTTVSVGESFDDPLGANTQGSGRPSVDESEPDAPGREGGGDSRGHLQRGSPQQHKEVGMEAVGQASQAESTAFGAWLSADSPEEWLAVGRLLKEALPQLLYITRMVPLQEQTEGLRRRIRGTLRAVCRTFGEELTRGAILPLVMAAATLSLFQGPVPKHVGSLAQTLLPQGSEGARVARLCVLPQLLAAVLPCAGAGAVAAMLRLLMAESVDGDPWALAFPQEMSGALRFAAGFEELQGQLLALLWELTAKPSAAARLCAAQLAAAVSPSLPHSLLRRQVLPALVKLVDDSALSVKVAAVEGLAALWQMAAASSSLLEELHRHLDSVMSAGIHEVELAIVASLSRKARAVTDMQLEYLLQKVLLLLASMHQRAAAGRSPMQLKAAAAAILDTLGSIASCEIGEQTVSLHLLAALQALRREAELLEPLQRERLDQLTQHQSASTPAMRSPERAAIRPSPQQAVRLQMSSISSDADGLDSGRTSRSSSQGLDSVRQGPEPSLGSRQSGGRGKKGGNSMWRESGKAMFRSVSGMKPS